MVRLEDLSRVKKRNGLNRSSIPNEETGGFLGGSGRQWIDEEMGINDMIQLRYYLTNQSIDRSIEQTNHTKPMNQSTPATFI